MRVETGRELIKRVWGGTEASTAAAVGVVPVLDEFLAGDVELLEAVVKIVDEKRFPVRSDLENADPVIAAIFLGLRRGKWYLMSWLPMLNVFYGFGEFSV